MWLLGIMRANPRAVVAGVAILGVLAASGWLISVIRDRDRLERELADEKRRVIIQQQTIDQMQESIRVYRVYRDEAIEKDRQFDELVRNLEALSGGDAPLSDFMRDAAGRLFPQ